jgi:HlyD family secretion protein
MGGLKRALSIGLKVLVAVVVVGAAIRLWPKEMVEVGVVRLERGDVRDVVTPISSGTVKAARYARVRSQTVGEVERIFFRKGDRVKKGDLVVRLKNREQRARLDLSRANLAAGMASRKQAALRNEQLAKSFERTKKLFDQKIASESSLEQIETEKGVSGELIAAADANLAQLKAAMDIADAAFDATFFHAPFDGVIAAVTPEEGESLSPGLPVYEIYDDTAVKVEAAVDEVDAARLTVGMSAQITTDALPGSVIDARVSWIAPLVTHDIKGSRNVDISLEIEKGDPHLKVGMSVDVDIVVSRHPGVPYLPTNAVMGKGTSRQVLVAAEGFAKEKKVKTGLSDWEMTEITDGLSPEDQVIFTLNAPGLAPGARVKINPLLNPAKGR